MIENTKLLDKKQKEYDDWKEAMYKELDARFNDQAEKIGNLDEKIESQAGKLDSLLVSMTSITKNVATDQNIKSMLAISTHSWSRQTIFQTLTAFCKARPNNPPVESLKKRHKSLDDVCYTPNIIMGSQEQT
eukprot:8114681-Ditylum_brightwellii.AAC.1